MKIRNIQTIISREYLTRVKKKSFLLTTFIVPVLFAAMCILPSVIMFMAKDEGKKIAVVDQSGMVMPYLVSNDAVTYTDCSTEPADSMKTGFEALGYDALVVVSPLDSVAKTVSVVSYSTKPLSVDLKDRISSRAEEAIEDYRISLYDMGNLKQIMEDVKVDISMSTYTMDESGETIRYIPSFNFSVFGEISKSNNGFNLRSTIASWALTIVSPDASTTTTPRNDTSRGKRRRNFSIEICMPVASETNAHAVSFKKL